MSQHGEDELQPATMLHVKQAIRRKLRKHGEHEHYGLNIYPMMDMMTILLVFMVMQFASSTAAVIQQSEELKLPYSTSDVLLGETTAIQISKSEIVVDGKLVLRLRNGVVDPSDKRDGAQGFLVTPLHKKMSTVRDVRKQIAASDPRRPFTGDVQIIADAETPFRTLSEVIYTLGQSEFGNLHFVTSGKK
jgi:biopolymer transport protein ExbD